MWSINTNVYNLCTHVSETEAITQHTVKLTETISNDLIYFSGMFIEKSFITRHVSSTTLDMRGIGKDEKARTLLDKVQANLNVTQNKETWFQNFIAIFSVDPTYKPLADRMMQTYKSGS